MKSLISIRKIKLDLHGVNGIVGFSWSCQWSLIKKKLTRGKLPHFLSFFSKKVGVSRLSTPKIMSHRLPPLFQIPQNFGGTPRIWMCLLFLFFSYTPRIWMCTTLFHIFSQTAPEHFLGRVSHIQRLSDQFFSERSHNSCSEDFSEQLWERLKTYECKDPWWPRALVQARSKSRSAVLHKQ